MVNATDSNETNETNETNDSQPEVASGEARLLLQLGRLPADHLERVHQAMEELQAAGLSELSDISALAKEVKSGSAEGNARLPSEHHTSEYMGMSLWSWTPKRWSESIENSGEPAGAKSGDLQTDEVELPVVPEKTLQSSAWRGERCQEFKTWFDSMMKADAEIRSMASMDTSVKHSGDGPGVLFAKTAKIEGFGTLPRFKSKEASIMMDFRGGQMPTSKRPSLPIGAKPNTAPAIVSIHLDDDVGVDYWQYVMKEHYLKPSGKAEQEFYGCSDVMFSCSKSGRYVPRAILAGSPTRMDVASQASIFDPTSIVNSPEYSMAEGATGAELPELMEALRMQMERSDFCEGVVISQTIGKDYRSSALLQCILLNIMQDMPKMFKVTCACIPDVQADPDRAAANAGLCTRHLLESDLVAYYDATSLKNMASAKVTSPSDADCRGLAVRFLSGLTGPMRFGRFANSTPTCLACYGQSLMPYPRMKYTFPLIGHGPGSGLEVAGTAIACGSLCTANNRAGKTIAATMLCRGMEQSMALAAVIPRRVSHAEHWVDYAKGGFTIHSYQDPKCPEPQVTILENTGRAKTVIEHQLKGLDLESQSCDCAEIIEDLTALAADFDEVTAETVEDEGEDEEEVE